MEFCINSILIKNQINLTKSKTKFKIKMGQPDSSNI